MAGIFLNYRREDSAPCAGRLHDLLCRAFPEHTIFMDIEGIQAGDAAEAAALRTEWKRTDQQVLDTEQCIRFLVTRLGTSDADVEVEEHAYQDGIRQPSAAPSRIVLVEPTVAKEQLRLRPASE